jgi:hypothetical protein
MAEPRDDLRATAEAIQEDARQVEELEAEKLALDPADPRVVLLSEEVEALAGRLAHKAKAERDLSHEIQVLNSLGRIAGGEKRHPRRDTIDSSCRGPHRFRAKR